VTHNAAEVIAYGTAVKFKYTIKSVPGKRLNDSDGF
jgi:hypothetical protein